MRVQGLGEVAAAAAPRGPIVLTFSANLAMALAALAIGAAAIVHFGTDDHSLHTVLDTSVALTSALIALLLWDVSRRNDQTWPLLLAIVFAMLAIGELVHVFALLGWFGGGSEADVRLRSGSWGPPALVLSCGVAASLILRNRPRRIAWPFAACALLLAVMLVAVFLSLPRYTEPWLLGVSRPSLLAVPLLWIGIGIFCWTHREESEIMRAIALTAVVFAIAHGVMLYSQASSDIAAIIAHLGKFVAAALLLSSLIQIGAADSARRQAAERELVELNRDLDRRVAERTAEQRRSQHMIDAIVTNSGAVIYVKDLEGRYLLVNQRFAEAFKVDRAATIGRTDHDLFGKEAADAFREMDERVASADRPLTEEETAPLDDGLHTYISVKAPLRDEVGKTYAVFGISTDITEAKRAEEALHASEQRNRLVVESALDAVVTMDRSGVVTGWNPQAETTFGWTGDEAVGRRVDEVLIPRRHRAAHKDGLARYLATGEARVLNKRIELDALHRSGHEFPVELSITPIGTGAGLAFTAFLRDITDRKLADARLQTQLDRLHLLEEITRAVGQRLDTSSIFQVAVRALEDRLPADFVGICRYHPDKHALTVAHVGVGSAPLGHDLGMDEQAEVPIDQNGLSRCLAGALVYEPDVREVDFPFPQRLARQGLRSLVITPLIIEKQVFGVLLAARTVEHGFVSSDCEFLKQLGEHIALAAHQAQLRENLQRAYDDLRQTQQAVLEQERLRAIGQMASGIAHDINNAISPVALYTQSLLERQHELIPDVRDYLEIVGRVVKDISATVSRMRDFYRPDEGVAEHEPVDLNVLVPQVVELTRARWSDMPQRRGVVITVSSALETDLPRVMGNPAELREALTNLIFNAVDAMPGGGAITVRTQTLAAGKARRVRLEVGDTGAGMDEETRRRCLEPFFTTKGERGTGLGLAMVHGAAQRHKAELGIDSAPGEGARIRIDFAAATKAQLKPKPIASPVEGRPLRLLLVDDDPAVLKSTSFVLTLNGHDVIGADGGQAGIDALRGAVAAGDQFDVIITDLGMPHVDGNQVAEAGKELFPATPIVLLTGWGRRMATGETAPAHVDFVLPKPLDLDELREVFAKIG